MNTLPTLLLVTAMAFSAGCSLSASSDSSAASSDSSANSSESSSRSSSPEGKEATYRDDIRDYTEAHARSGGPLDAFQRRISELARQHEITNWEDTLATYEAIGAGLGRARVNQTQVDAYKQNLGQGDPRKMDAIQAAYNAPS